MRISDFWLIVDKIILDIQKDSKIHTRRFIVTVVISVFSLIAAVIAAVAALIPLLWNSFLFDLLRQGLLLRLKQ